MKRFVLFTAAGAALVYFLDPQNGKRRRQTAVDRVAGFFRRLGKRARRTGRGAYSEMRGVGMKAAHIREKTKPEPNDATLVQKVESEVFRDPSIPKGQINVNAENGVVVLRGQVDSPDLIEELEKKVRNVQGVRDVENLLQAVESPGAPGL
jgi:osmotically-inducible protein OsmY